MAFNRGRSLPASNLGSLSKDITLPPDADDTISSVSWSSVTNHLAAASWDGKVRIYDVKPDGSAQGVAMLSAEGPVFDCDWAKDGTMVLAAGADRKIHILDAATGQQATAGAHDAPVRGARFVDVVGSSARAVVASGSWDRTVKFWDLRQRGPAAAMTLACEERVYAMDAAARLLVVATAGRRVHLVDLRNPAAFLRTLESPLRHQTTAVAAFPDGAGWATASIEGRCGISALDEQETSKVNFTFRCHREQQQQPDATAAAAKVTKVWAVNDVRFHPAHPTTFATAGSDGTFSFWDRVAHARLGAYSPPPAADTDAAADGGTRSAITATAFSRDGALFAYATGYDWSRGCAANSPRVRTRLLLHPVAEDEVAPRRGR